jgi:GNAT superfamily N-acetyltransferase
MHTGVVIRPVEPSDAESLGRVHAACWHESYDELLSAAALAHLRPERLAVLWRRYTSQGPDYRLVAAVVDGEVVGFAGSGPDRDGDKPTPHELYSIHLLHSFHGTGIGQQLFDAAIDPGPAHLWVPQTNPRAHAFYRRNGFAPDGHEKVEEVLGELLHEVRLVR